MPTKRRTTPAPRAARRATASTATAFDRPRSVDNLTRLLDAKKLVPDNLKGTDKFLDIVAWNIRFFDAADPKRVKAITEILASLNADIFILTEIAEDGALDQVAANLAARDAGYYSIKYGTTGAQQRVVLMWDRDWVRAKEAPAEILQDKNVEIVTELGRKKVFPRLPLWGYFECLPPSDDDETVSSGEGFTFELLGLHLKAQGPKPREYTGPVTRFGIPQRTESAKVLAEWLSTPEKHYDTDIIVVGDWNAVPDAPEWKALNKLEEEGNVSFSKINEADEASHLVRLNQSGPAGSRIDLTLVTTEAEANAVSEQELGAVIRWKPFEDLSAFTADERKKLLTAIKALYSDHMPVVSRFYLTDGSD